jgi:hypothetical protein
MKRRFWSASAAWTRAIAAPRTMNSCCAPASTRKRSKDSQDPVPLAGGPGFRRQSARREARSEPRWRTGVEIGISGKNRARRAGGGSGGLPLSGPLSHCRRSARQYPHSHRRPQERLPRVEEVLDKDGIPELRNHVDRQLPRNAAWKNMPARWPRAKRPFADTSIGAASHSTSRMNNAAARMTASPYSCS